MSVELATEHRADQDVPLPLLKPVLVAPAVDVEALLRERRSELAELHLRQRRTRYELEELTAAAPASELARAQALLEDTLSLQFAARRRQHEAELDAARAEAANVVATAQHEATELLAAANTVLVEAFLGGAVTSVPHPPVLRVVGGPVPAGSDLHPTITARVSMPVTEPMPAVAMPRETDVSPDVPVSAPIPAPILPPPPDDARAPQRWTLRPFLYLDVVLPLVAVLIVIVIVLAWVG